MASRTGNVFRKAIAIDDEVNRFSGWGIGSSASISWSSKFLGGSVSNWSTEISAGPPDSILDCRQTSKIVFHNLRRISDANPDRFGIWTGSLCSPIYTAVRINVPAAIQFIPPSTPSNSRARNNRMCACRNGIPRRALYSGSANHVWAS